MTQKPTADAAGGSQACALTLREMIASTGQGNCRQAEHSSNTCAAVLRGANASSPPPPPSPPPSMAAATAACPPCPARQPCCQLPMPPHPRFRRGRRRDWGGSVAIATPSALLVPGGRSARPLLLLLLAWTHTCIYFKHRRQQVERRSRRNRAVRGVHSVRGLRAGSFGAGVAQGALHARLDGSRRPGQETEREAGALALPSPRSSPWWYAGARVIERGWAERPPSVSRLAPRCPSVLWRPHAGCWTCGAA
jgi:hypothetical protein